LERPNILLLYTDQQRWDALGANGNPEIHTPALDRLAAEGINFARHFVQNPVCMPSRVSMLSGQYPSTLGILRNGVPVPAETVTLPHLLRNYGYTSANIGKLHFLPHANRDHRDVHPDYGFDHLEISDEPGCYEDAYRAWVRRRAPEQLDAISVGLPPAAHTWYRTMGIQDPVKHPVAGGRSDVEGAISFPGDEGLTHSAFVAERTIAFLRQHRERPFFCVAGFYSPHAPWVVPQRYLDMYDPGILTLPSFPPELEARRAGARCSDEQLRSARHGYYAMVSEVDDRVRQILSCLDDLGLANSTIVVFTSDHGEWLGEHLRYGKGYPGHDCVSRVPLIVRWPSGISAPGRTVSTLVESVDILPTLLGCAGIPIPYHLQGSSLLPALENRSLESRASALTEMAGWITLRTERYRYVAEADGSEMLYDLAVDPHGYHDVAGEPASAPTIAALRHELLKRLIARERPLRRTWPY
jgi:arylsulfatase A-like enzyme